MLEVYAGAELPRQLVCAIHFEDISGIEIQIIVAAINVAVRIVEIIRVGIVGIPTAEGALLALNREATQHLPAV